jgi:uncharacterized membrane protein YfcA
MTQSLLLIVLGLLSGCLGGLLGIGGGIIMVPALVYLVGLSPQRAAAISLTVIIPTALASLMTHLAHQPIEWRYPILITAGALIGGLCGATLSHALPAETIKKIFAVFLVILGISLFLQKPKAAQDATAKVSQNSNVVAPEKL